MFRISRLVSTLKNCSQSTKISFPLVSRSQVVLQKRLFSEQNESSSSSSSSSSKSGNNVDPYNAKALNQFFEALDPKGRIRPAGEKLILKKIKKNKYWIKKSIN